MIEVRRLDAQELRTQLDALASVLHDCVDGGASVSFMWPFSEDDARAYFETVAADVEAGGRMLLAAFDDDELVGTVQITHVWPPNQRHRADITKLLVRTSARGRGIAQRLMETAEEEARAEGKTVLVLDTITDSPAYRLYQRLGYVVVGEIPDFALYPDGRPCPTTFFYKRI